MLGAITNVGIPGIGGARTLLLNVRRRSSVDPDKGVLNLDERSCFVAQSSEPCTHKPMKPKCEGPNTISEPHAKWMKKHLQECQDWPGGLQLVFDVEQPNNSSHMWDHLNSQWPWKCFKFVCKCTTFSCSYILESFQNDVHKRSISFEVVKTCIMNSKCTTQEWSLWQPFSYPTTDSHTYLTTAKLRLGT